MIVSALKNALKNAQKQHAKHAFEDKKELIATIILSDFNEEHNQSLFSNNNTVYIPPFTKMALQLGANILVAPPHQDPFSFAQKYVQGIPKRILLNSGFDYPLVIREIARVARKTSQLIQSSELASVTARSERSERSASTFAFDECWCAVGSGTLIRGLQKAKIARRYFGVCVFQECPDIANAKGIVPSLSFSEFVSKENTPPFPSALRYDAKVWLHIKNRPGKILFWNVM